MGRRLKASYEDYSAHHVIHAIKELLSEIDEGLGSDAHGDAIVRWTRELLPKIEPLVKKPPKLTAAQLKSLARKEFVATLAWQDSPPLSWTEITDRFNQEFGDSLSQEAIRSLWRDWLKMHGFDPKLTPEEAHRRERDWFNRTGMVVTLKPYPNRRQPVK